MMLRIAPHLVGDLRSVEDVDWGNPFDPASRGLDHARAAPCPAISATRAEPPPNKGETLFQVFSAQVVALLERVLDLGRAKLERVKAVVNG